MPKIMSFPAAMKDREYFKRGLETNGYVVTNTPGATT